MEIAQAIVLAASPVAAVEHSSIDMPNLLKAGLGADQHPSTRVWLPEGLSISASGASGYGCWSRVFVSASAA
jgi:hypothetical protein